MAKSNSSSMSVTVGKVPEFNPNEDDWNTYIEQLEFFFEANRISHEVQRKAILLSSCGITMYKLFKGLTGQSKPGEKSFDELKQLMLDHENPRPNMIDKRFKFSSRVRNANESVSMFVAELRKLTEYCKYGESLNDMLRDRLVCGINHERTQQRLLSEGSTLTLEKALDIALSLESAISQTAVIQSGYMNNKSETQILKVSDKEVKKCYQCDGNHAAKSCPFIDKECFYCYNKGHTSKVCRKRAKAIKVKVNNVVQTKENSTEVDDDEFYDIYSLSMSRNPPLVVEAKINGTDVKMEVDTGASKSIINMETYNTTKRKCDSLTYTNSKLRTYSGDLMKPEEMIEASFMYENQCLVVQFIVATTKGPNLLGSDVLRLLRLNWEKLLNAFHAEENVRTENCLNKILSDYKEVFKSEMGTLKGFEV